MKHIPHTDGPLPDHIVKGNLVENIVASLHSNPDVKVGVKEKLPSRANPENKREIDVLLTAQLAGYPIHIAFECKNYKEKIGVAQIDEFKGKLEDVGIPVQQGIYVCVNGFTKDARSRAESLGMRVRRLEGLTPERLSSEIHAAFQSIVYLLMSVKTLTVTNDALSDGDFDLLSFKDKDGNYAGTVIDLIWAKWRDGEIAYEIGEQEVEVIVPPTWTWLIPGDEYPSTARAVIEVMGCIINIEGAAERHILRDESTGEVDRLRVNTTFDDHRKSLPVVTVRTEAELERATQQPAVANIVVGRIPLPRIRWSFYWPPSLRVVLELKRRTDELVCEGRWSPGALKDVPFKEFEGSDLSAMWEAIWPAHPAASDDKWPWSKPRQSPV